MKKITYEKERKRKGIRLIFLRLEVCATTSCVLSAAPQPARHGARKTKRDSS